MENTNLGRPTKLNEKYIKAFDKVVNKPNSKRAVYLTLEELLILTNIEYGDEDYICYNTFENWKKGDLKDSIIKDFLGVYKKALIVQKEQLFSNLETEDKTWQRWAWTIERKFNEWNLKNINENTSTNTNHNHNQELTKEEIKRLKDEFGKKY